MKEETNHHDNTTLLYSLSLHIEQIACSAKMYYLLPTLIQAALLPQIIASYVTRAAYQNQTYTTKSLTTNSGHTYVYDFVPASNTSKPTLFLLHGYPASRHDWEHQIAALNAEGYGIVAPDLLGFGQFPPATQGLLLRHYMAWRNEMLIMDQAVISAWV
jgi:hypothetical protein